MISGLNSHVLSRNVILSKNRIKTIGEKCVLKDTLCVALTESILVYTKIYHTTHFTYQTRV